jgi:hypothetical protein
MKIRRVIAILLIVCFVVSLAATTVSAEKKARVQALDANNAFVLGNDGNLWYTPDQSGQIPDSNSIQVDGNVVDFQALDANTVFVLGSDGNLWGTPGPFGQVPNPNRVQVDGNVVDFQAVDANTVYVRGSDGNL